MDESIYEELGRHLDKAVAGVPMSPKLLEILQILYPGEEAEVALELAFYENRTLVDVEAATWYGHVRESMNDWADQFVLLANTPKDVAVEDSSAFTLLPW